MIVQETKTSSGAAYKKPSYLCTGSKAKTMEKCIGSIVNAGTKGLPQKPTHFWILSALMVWIGKLKDADVAHEAADAFVRLFLKNAKTTSYRTSNPFRAGLAFIHHTAAEAKFGALEKAAKAVTQKQVAVHKATAQLELDQHKVQTTIGQVQSAEEEAHAAQTAQTQAQEKVDRLSTEVKATQQQTI